MLLVTSPSRCQQHLQPGVEQEVPGDQSTQPGITTILLTTTCRTASTCSPVSALQCCTWQVCSAADCKAGCKASYPLES